MFVLTVQSQRKQYEASQFVPIVEHAFVLMVKLAERNGMEAEL
jgi:hypothetical protein